MFSITRQYASDHGTNRSKSQHSCMYSHEDVDTSTGHNDPYRKESDTQYEIAQLKEKVTKLREEDSQQREKYQQQEIELESLQESNRLLENRTMSLSDELLKVNYENDVLSNEMSVMHDQNVSWKVDNDRLKRMIIRLQAEIDREDKINPETATAALESVRAQVANKIEQAQQRHKEILDEAKLASVNEEEAWNQVDEMEVAVVEMSAEVEGKNEVIKYLRDHVQQMAAEKSEMEQSLRKLQEKVDCRNGESLPKRKIKIERIRPLDLLQRTSRRPSTENCSNGVTGSKNNSIVVSTEKHIKEEQSFRRDSMESAKSLDSFVNLFSRKHRQTDQDATTAASSSSSNKSKCETNRDNC